MKRMAIAVPVVVSIALAAAGCTKKDDVPQDSPSVAPAQAGASNDHAGQFLTTAIAGDDGEITLGQLAAKKASSKDVRALAQTLVQDHGKSKAQAVQLANGMGAVVPSTPRDDANTEFDKLQNLAGADFDKEFVSFMVQDHQQAINSYQAEAGSTDSAQVASFARQTLPTLRKHLEMAQSLETGFNAKGR